MTYLDRAILADVFLGRADECRLRDFFVSFLFPRRGKLSTKSKAEK